MLKAQAIAVVKLADAHFPGQRPGFERLVATTRIEEVPAYMGPAESQQDGVG